MPRRSVDWTRKVRKALGLLKGKVPYEPFDRHKDGLWPPE